MPRASKAVDAVKQLGRKAAAAGATKSTSKAAAKAGKPAAKSTTSEKRSSKVTKTSGTTVSAKAKKAAAAKKGTSVSKAPAAKKLQKAPAKAVAKRAEKPAPAKAPKPTKKLEGAGTDKFLEEQRVLLEEERISYLAQAADLKAEADQLAQEMEPGDIQFDDESGEGATAAVDRERDLALSAQARVEVDEIDHALAKLDGGSYGICEGCGQPVPRARLKALPHARLCVACKSGGLSRR